MSPMSKSYTEEYLAASLIVSIILITGYLLVSGLGEALDKEHEIHCRATAKDVQACLNYGKAVVNE